MQLSFQQTEAINQCLKEKTLIAWWKVGEGKTRIAVGVAEKIRTSASVSEEGGIWVAVLRRKAFWDLENELKKTNTRKHWIIEEFTSTCQWRSGQWKLWMVSAGQLKKYETQLEKIAKSGAVKFVYVDELYMFGNPTSQRSKSLRTFVKSARGIRLGVSGTIMPCEDNTSIFGQTKALGIESYVARTLTDFRSKYQICRINDLQRYKIVRRINKPGSVKLLTARLSRFVNIYFPPPSREIKIQDIKVPCTSQQTKFIKQITKEFWYEIQPKLETGSSIQRGNRDEMQAAGCLHTISNEVAAEYPRELRRCPTSPSSSEPSRIYETNTALEVATRLRQVSSGWLPTENGVVRIQTNKTIALKEMVEELLAAHEQVLIWVAFRRDIEIVSELFETPPFQMVGGKAFDADKFEREKPRVVVATEGSGSSVNHFKNFRFAIYYSYQYDWLSMQQSMGRSDRKDGMEGPRNYIYLIADEPSIDAYVLENARSAGSTETTFLKLFDKWKHKSLNG